MNVKKLLTKLTLPKQFESYIDLYFAPIVKIIHQLSLQHSVPVIGINGSQGSGKTTAAIIIQALLEDQSEHPVAIVSIDDFYHTRATRENLSKSLHPLFITRGVPGTHDIPLALETIKRLKNLSKGETMLIPRFDKARDDREPETQWKEITGPISAIIFEGWCVGSPALDADDLIEPINHLEQNEDQNGQWRKTYNQYLQQQYPTLFKQIDWLLMLKVPSFDVVYHWRLLQEQKLAIKLKNKSAASKKQLLNEAQIERFIQHYQRITEHNLSVIPELADAVITLDEQHQMTYLQIKKGSNR